MVLLMPVETVRSHPHVFLHSKVDAVFDKNGLAGFHIYWKFDEMFSTMRINEYDRNGNGKFEKKELASLQKGAFDNLKKSDYFCNVTIGGNELKVKHVKNFHAWIKDSILYYSFRIPCHVKAIEKEKIVKLSIYDSSFYCSVFLAEKPVRFKNAEQFDFGYSVKRNKKKAYYYGQIYPEEITFTFKETP
ncbi:MAG: DUF1007 family protein [Thermodesulfobacteriota bacterium]